jgi:hypothetical protein
MVFKKVGGAIKTFVRNTKERLTKGVKLLGPNLLNVSQKGLGLLAKVPGSVGMVASGVNTGIEVVKNLAKDIPNEKAKAAVNSMIAKGSNVMQNATSTANKFADKASPWMHLVNNAASSLNSAIT